MAKSAADRVSLRGGVYYYIRRVPTHLTELDTRTIVRISLHTGDLKKALLAAVVAEQELELLWSTLKAQGSLDAWTRYRAAMERARLEGFVYRPADEVAGLRVDEILRRMESLAGREADPSAVHAIAGGAGRPEVTIKAALKLYKDYVASELIGKRDDQVRRWNNARDLAVAGFVACLGEDKAITDLTRDDGRKFRDLWLGRVRTEGYGRNAMNKQISHLSRMLHVVNEEMKLGLDPIFTGLSVKEIKAERPPFSRAFVEDTILAPGALAGLNLDARVALLVCAETGMGAEEVTSLRADTIHLDAPVPYVAVVAREGAEQKTEYRPRQIPLVGVALAAMKLRPAGIERYYDKNASLSAAINKFMRDNNLMPSPRHSLYSFRHSFQDRLTEVEAPDRLQAELMGHKYIREKYGKGPDLAQKRRWLDKIAYAIPEGFAVHQA